jgi:hypothetical protein
LHEVELGKLAVELAKHIRKRKCFLITVTVRASTLRNRGKMVLDRKMRVCPGGCIMIRERCIVDVDMDFGSGRLGTCGLANAAFMFT